MPFTDLELPQAIFSTDHDPIRDFFVPVLGQSVLYDVAVGYFTSGWIRDAAEGIAALAKNGGRSRWVISPNLTQDDWDTLSALTGEQAEDHIQNLAAFSLEQLIEELREDTRKVLGWMVHDRILSFRVAVPKNRLSGIFHAKIGVFEDGEGNRIGFSGSYNMTAGANTNWESMDIFRSWEPGEAGRIDAKSAQFGKIWDRLDPNLTVYKPTDTSLKPLVEIVKHTERPYPRPPQVETPAADAPSPPPRRVPRIPDTYAQLRPHQEQAIEGWFANKGRGIYHMATGSGKTVTALATAVQLVEKLDKAIVIVAVPQRHLARQWSEEALAFGFDPVLCYESSSTWVSAAQDALVDYNLELTSNLFLITVNKTFMGMHFQGLLEKMAGPVLFVADEMHNLGGRAIKELLPERVPYRLGLSATPDRHYDKEGTALLRSYFGETVIEYGIAEAIADGTLCSYYYYPELVPFTDQEMHEYRELSAKISRLWGAGADPDDEGSGGSLDKLLIKRARLIAGAGNKLPRLVELLGETDESPYTLVYCGDEREDGERQVDKVVRVIGKDLGKRCDRFTMTESTAERAALLRSFAEGMLHILVSVRCLDEGVDVPRTQKAYILASTSNPRQFIQRRGRILRRAAGKEHATIHDFITVPPDSAGFGPGDGAFGAERNLMRRELARVGEFASVALNSGVALQRLRHIKERYNLMDE